MRGAPLRIERHDNQEHLGVDAAGPAPAGKFAEAITKLIPGEVVAAYLAGKAVLQAGTANQDGTAAQAVTTAGAPGLVWWIGWTVFCLAVVIGLRRWMTSDSAAGVPVEWSAVITSALSFLIWVYSFGDVFLMLGWWNRLGSALVLIGWTLAAPLLLFGLKRVFRD